MKMCASADPGGDREAVPALWSPSAAVAWSLVFTPVFGAWVQMMNWAALGDRHQAAASRAWAYASALALLGAYAVMLAAPQDSPWHETGRAVGIGLLATWYLLSGKPQADLVRKRFGTGYTHRSWGPPLFLGTLVYGIYVVGTNWLAAIILRSAAVA
jgi:hypothetical protein